MGPRFELGRTDSSGVFHAATGIPAATGLTSASYDAAQTDVLNIPALTLTDVVYFYTLLMSADTNDAFFTVPGTQAPPATIDVKAIEIGTLGVEGVTGDVTYKIADDSPNKDDFVIQNGKLYYIGDDSGDYETALERALELKIEHSLTGTHDTTGGQTAQRDGLATADEGNIDDATFTYTGGGVSGGGFVAQVAGNPATQAVWEVQSGNAYSYTAKATGAEPKRLVSTGCCSKQRNRRIGHHKRRRRRGSSLLR